MCFEGGAEKIAAVSWNRRCESESLRVRDETGDRWRYGAGEVRTRRLPNGSVNGELRNLKMGAGFDGTRNRAQRDKRSRMGDGCDGEGSLRERGEGCQRMA